MKREYIENYFQYGVDIDNRRVFLSSDIEEISIATAIKSIYLLDSISNSKPLELYIASFGGDLYSMFALYDVLNSIKCPVHTIAIGKCMSATPVLISAGTKGHRYSMPNTQFMLHQITIDTGCEVRLDLASLHMKHDADLLNKYIELLTKNTKQPASFWKKLLSKQGDQYFSADEAVEWGIVDHIWSEK